MFRITARLLAALLLAASVITAGAGMARAETPYFTEIAEAYGGGTRVWSDEERRNDAFTAGERTEFDREVYRLSHEDNDNRLPYGLEVFVAQIDYVAAHAATEDGLDPIDELEKAIRAEFGYEGNLLIAIIDGDQLDVRAYGEDFPPRLLRWLDKITATANEIQGDPRGLLWSWLDDMSETDWSEFQPDGSEEPADPEPTATATVTATATATATVTTTATPATSDTPAANSNGTPWWVLPLILVLVAGAVGMVVWQVRANRQPGRRE